MKLYKLHKRDEGICFYCKKHISLEESTRDHIVPKSTGGTDVHENIVLCCLDCNKSKGCMDPADWIKRKDPSHMSQEAKDLLLG